MIEDYIPIVSSILTIVLCLITTFLIVEVKRRVTGGMISTLNLLIVANLLIMIERGITLLITIQMLDSVFSYVNEIAIFFFAVFLFLAAVNFYRFTKGTKRSNAEIREGTRPLTEGKIDYYKLLSKISEEEIIQRKKDKDLAKKLKKTLKLIK